MDSEADYILGAIAIGIGATLVMDLWNLFLKRTFSIPSLNYCLLSPPRHRNPSSARLAGLPTTRSVSCSRLCSSFLHQVPGLRDQLCCLRCSTALAP